MNSDSALRALLEIQRILTNTALEKRTTDVSEHSISTEPSSSIVKTVITRKVSAFDPNMFGPRKRSSIKSSNVQTNSVRNIEVYISIEQSLNFIINYLNSN